MEWMPWKHRVGLIVGGLTVIGLSYVSSTMPFGPTPAAGSFTGDISMPLGLFAIVSPILGGVAFLSGMFGLRGKDPSE